MDSLRTVVVLAMSWLMVSISGRKNDVKRVNKRELIFICLSGIATGASWLCYYKALQMGQASIVVPIDKLSILITVLFSYFVFNEKLTKKSFSGLCMIVIGTLLMIGVL